MAKQHDITVFFFLFEIRAQFLKQEQAEPRVCVSVCV